MVPLKYLSNFGGTLEMPLINCEIDLILTWPVNWVISDAVNEATAIVMTYRKLHIPILNYHARASKLTKITEIRTENYLKLSCLRCYS